MTPPVPQPESRPAYIDPRDTLRLTTEHVVLAAALVALGHPVVHVATLGSLKRVRFVFERTARADFERLEHIMKELNANRERALQRPWSHQG